MDEKLVDYAAFNDTNQGLLSNIKCGTSLSKITSAEAFP